MNAILLTSEPDRQARAPRRAADAARVSPQRGGAADGGSIPDANVQPAVQHGASYRKWETTGSGVETALFVSVQAVMLVCVVLVAAQLFATA